VVVAVPGKNAQFYLLFTRNKDIYFTFNQPLIPVNKVKQPLQKAN
jgi:hypothetical protein